MPKTLALHPNSQGLVLLPYRRFLIRGHIAGRHFFICFKLLAPLVVRKGSRAWRLFPPSHREKEKGSYKFTINYHVPTSYPDPDRLRLTLSEARRAGL